MKVPLAFLVFALATCQYSLAKDVDVTDQAVRKGQPIDGAPDEAELAEVQGKWERPIKTPNGVGKIVKEHKGSETTLRVIDANGKILASKLSEFRLEKTGRVRVFTFFNNVVTSGPQKGQVDKTEKSYIYRIDGDTFIEVGGLLLGDKGETTVLQWKRVKE